MRFIITLCIIGSMKARKSRKERVTKALSSSRKSILSSLPKIILPAHLKLAEIKE